MSHAARRGARWRGGKAGGRASTRGASHRSLLLLLRRRRRPRWRAAIIPCSHHPTLARGCSSWGHLCSRVPRRAALRAPMSTLCPRSGMVHAARAQTTCGQPPPTHCRPSQRTLSRAPMAAHRQRRSRRLRVPKILAALGRRAPWGLDLRSSRVVPLCHHRPKAPGGGPVDEERRRRRWGSRRCGCRPSRCSHSRACTWCPWTRPCTSAWPSRAS